MQLGLFRVDPRTSTNEPSARSVPRSNCQKEGESIVTFTDLVQYLRARFQLEEGQTMAEYGVVLAVIALGVVVALGLLSGAISTAIGNVVSKL
jgi:Flp pilus assembly pilin Flp